jgi:hypothetical protein
MHLGAICKYPNQVTLVASYRELGEVDGSGCQHPRAAHGTLARPQHGPCERAGRDHRQPPTCAAARRRSATSSASAPCADRGEIRGLFQVKRYSARVPASKQTAAISRWPVTLSSLAVPRRAGLSRSTTLPRPGSASSPDTERLHLSDRERAASFHHRTRSVPILASRHRNRNAVPRRRP